MRQRSACLNVHGQQIDASSEPSLAMWLFRGLSPAPDLNHRAPLPDCSVRALRGRSASRWAHLLSPRCANLRCRCAKSATHPCIEVMQCKLMRTETVRPNKNAMQSNSQDIDLHANYVLA